MLSTSPQSAAASDHTPQAPLCLDEGTFVGFVKAHYERSFNYAKSILGNKADAEDAVQTVFFRIWQMIALRGNLCLENVEWYVLTATRNAAFDLLRQRKRHVPKGSIGQNDEFALDSAASEACWQAQHDATLREALEDAMSKMPEDERVALKLKYWKGLSSVEIAVRIGKSKPEDSHEAKEKAANRVLERARPRLATILLGYE